MTKVRRRFFIKLAVGVSILAFIIYQTDLIALREVLGRVNIWVFLSLPMFYIQTLFKSLRWTTYLRSKGIAMGHRESYVLYTQCMLLGLISPGRIGELYRAFVLSRRRNVPIGLSFASVVIDRCADVFLLTAIGLGGTGYLWWGGSFAQSVVQGAIIAPATNLLKTARSKILATLNRLSAGRPFDAQAQYVEFKRGFTGLSLGLLSALTILTLMSIFSHTLQLWIIAKAIDVPMSFLEIVAVFSASFIINLIPVSINGIGTRDAFMVTVLPMMGVDRATALGFALMFILIQFANILMCLPFWLARDKETIEAFETRQANGVG